MRDWAERLVGAADAATVELIMSTNATARARINVMILSW
jgi:hypothetical protein